MIVSDIVKLRKMRTGKLQNDINRPGCLVRKSTCQIQYYAADQETGQNDKITVEGTVF